jgi:hypothetical protein
MRKREVQIGIPLKLVERITPRIGFILKGVADNGGQTRLCWL